MAVVTLTKVYITLLTTQDYVAAFSTGRSRQHQMDGEVRTYAGGRQRAVTSEGIQGTFSFTIRLISLATVETLRQWIGQTVLVRDHRGQKFYGVFHVVTPIENQESAFYDVTIPLKVIDYNEEV